jgi:outer membrane receptor protein involved in Fe transport
MEQSAKPLAGVSIVLYDESGAKIAGAVTEADGSFLLPAILQGKYWLQASLTGFQDYEAVVTLSSGRQTRAAVVLKLRQINETVEVVAQSAAEVLTSLETLSARIADVEPVKGDDYQALLPLVPGVVRTPDGRISIKGAGATQSGLMVSSSNVADPSTGNPGFELPLDAVESVSVLANPYSAEYGRFSSGTTQIQTRKGDVRWGFVVNSIIPRLRWRNDTISGIERFAPRLTFGGPLIRDRLTFSQSFQYRFIRTSVPALPPLQRDQRLESFDSFTRVDANLSKHHRLETTFALYPRKLDFVNLNTFNPMEVSANMHQRGYQIGFQETAVLTPSSVLETVFTYRTYDAGIFGQGLQPMRLYPEGNRGNFFNRQDRDTTTVQWIETYSRMVSGYKGQHLVKAGLDLMSSGLHDTDSNSNVEVYRADATLHRKIEYSGVKPQRLRATNVGAYLQDHWRWNDRLSFELGVRLDYDAVLRRTNVSPRAGAVISVLPQGRGVLRGGAGFFFEQTPLNVAAFDKYASPVVTRFGADGVTPLGPPVAWRLQTRTGLKTPSSFIWNVEYDQKLTPVWMVRINHMRRRGEHGYLIDPISSNTEASYLLDSRGRSRYWELELSLHFVRSDRFQMSMTYVRSRSETDLNNYDLFFGNLRNPIINHNEYSLAPTDVPHRFLSRAVLPFLYKFAFAPTFEIRTGFPYSTVDESQQFVGTRNRAGRFPTLATLDLRLTRPFKFLKWNAEAGARVYHVLNSFSPRDVQANVDACDFGAFYNTIPRNFAFTMQLRK